jgi:hypothetical protein
MKKIAHLFLSIFFVCSCGQRTDVDFIKGSRFYKDYDIFQRAGIDEIDSSNLEIPFIQEYIKTDSVITLRVYDSKLEEFETVKIPAKDGIQLRSNYNYSDAPNWIYGTIENGKIIRYGYESNPYDKDISSRKEIFLYDIIPHLVEIITEDTIKTIRFQSYFEEEYKIDVNETGDWEKMKNKMILPFDAGVDINSGFDDLKDMVHIEVIRDSADYYIRTIYASNAYGSDDKAKFGGSFHLVSCGAYFRPFRKYRSYLNPIRGM